MNIDLADLQRLLVVVAQEAARKALAEVALPVVRPATVTAVSGDTATVLVDGDSDPIDAQVITKNPVVTDRVLVQFDRGAVRVIGHQGGFT